MEILYMVLVAATVTYMVHCCWWDLKERMIYAFPCMVLSFFWLGTATVRGYQDTRILFAVVVALTVVYVTLTINKIWGSGDTDLFLLMLAVFLAQIKRELLVTDICLICIALVIALVFSIIVAYIEARIKGTKVEKDSSIALAPGFALVISLLIAGGFFR